MTSKFKCPYCQTELDYDEYGWDYSCSNPSCQKSLGILSGTEKLWQELSKLRCDLEIAVDALKRIKEPTAWGTLYQEQELATEALKQIEHKE